MSDSSQKPLAARFRSIDDLSAWAAKTYAGQYHKFVFERESKMVVIVIGTPTSGLPSGEVVVFQRALDGTYRVIVTRAMVYATVKVVEDVRGITFSTREPLLYIPWTGVLPDPDRVQ